MEVISSICNPIYGSLRGGWIRRTRRYQRLDNAAGKKKRNFKVLRLGGGKKRRFWKLRVVQKLRLKVVSLSPKLMMIRVRNAYVNFMLRLAGNVVSLNNGNVFGGDINKRIVNAEELSKVISPLEYEEKLVFEIYKVLVASQ